MAGYGRQGGNFTNTEPRFITYNLGVVPTVASTGATGGVWGFEYTNILQGKQIIATLPKVAPAYTTAQLAAITGLVQTLEAYNYMIVAEIHDTTGLEIQRGFGATTAPTQVCVKDGWAYIVSLLDSANDNLNIAGNIPIPVVLPPGFSAVSTTAGPSTAQGSFAAFNRALAGKAGLELAYAIARHTPASSPIAHLSWGAERGCADESRQRHHRLGTLRSGIAGAESGRRVHHDGPICGVFRLQRDIGRSGQSHQRPGQHALAAEGDDRRPGHG